MKLNYKKAAAGILLGYLLLCLDGCQNVTGMSQQEGLQITDSGAGTGTEAADGQSADAGTEAADEAAGQSADTGTEAAGQSADGIEWSAPERVDLSYAQEFTLDRYTNGCTLITISDGSVFLVVPETLADISDEELLCGVAQSAGSAAGAAGDTPGSMTDTEGAAVTVLRQPIGQIYLVASAVMDMFCSLDGLDHIRLSGTDADGWYIEEAQAAMEAGSILYAGKYSTPDYELILSEDCELAIENTMIEHSPEVRENLKSFGIPVMVDYSSYENHPLGRVEWIKLYGALLGKETEADQVFAAQEKILAEVEQNIAASKEKKRPTVAFFYITSNGAVNVRKASDYVPKMIELAGGTYVYHDLGDEESHSSSMTMQIEEFYATAKDADYIIYNSAIDGEVHSIEELYAKCELLADFKAVQEGHVCCTTKNLYQESMSIGGLIQDIHVMISDPGGDKQMKYLYPVN